MGSDHIFRSVSAITPAIFFPFLATRLPQYACVPDNVSLRYWPISFVLPLSPYTPRRLLQYRSSSLPLTSSISNHYITTPHLNYVLSHPVVFDIILSHHTLFDNYSTLFSLFSSLCVGSLSFSSLISFYPFRFVYATAFHVVDTATYVSVGFSLPLCRLVVRAHIILSFCLFVLGFYVWSTSLLSSSPPVPSTRTITSHHSALFYFCLILNIIISTPIHFCLSPWAICYCPRHRPSHLILISKTRPVLYSTSRLPLILLYYIAQHT